MRVFTFFLKDKEKQFIKNHKNYKALCKHARDTDQNLFVFKCPDRIHIQPIQSKFFEDAISVLGSEKGTLTELFMCFKRDLYAVKKTNKRVSMTLGKKIDHALRPKGFAINEKKQIVVFYTQPNPS